MTLMYLVNMNNIKKKTSFQYFYIFFKYNQINEQQLIKRIKFFLFFIVSIDLF